MATRYILKKPISYADTGTGTMRDATFIELREPTGKLVLECAPIRQFLVQALDQAESRQGGEIENDDGIPVIEVDEQEAPPPESPDPTEPGVDPTTMLYLLSRADIDLGKLYAHVRAMLCNGQVAFLDGEQPLTLPLYETMGRQDAELLIGAYCGAFFASS